MALVDPKRPFDRGSNSKSVLLKNGGRRRNHTLRFIEQRYSRSPESGT
jgi:hypothetical protein